MTPQSQNLESQNIEGQNIDTRISTCQKKRPWNQGRWKTRFL